MDYSRNGVIAGLYREGATLAVIGSRFGVTRERIRQIVTRAGVSSQNGGFAVQYQRKRLDRARCTDARYQQRFGLSRAEYLDIRRLPGRPTYKFQTQLQNACKRCIPWSLTLGAWWGVWRDSGHWAERGRGQGRYVMSRIGDRGGYATGNVFIQLSTDNSSHGPHKITNWPMGVQPSSPGRFMATKMLHGRQVYLGVFPDVSEAENAYQRACA